MLRMLVLGRRGAGISRRAAHEYLSDTHGRLVLCQPANSGATVRYYAQNHVTDGIYFAKSGAHAVERDLVTELCFDDLSAMQNGLASTYYRETLQPDETNFVDDANAVKMFLEPCTIIAGERGHDKLFLLLSRPHLTCDATWQVALAELKKALINLSGIISLTENIVLQPQLGARFADVIFEIWLDSQAAARNVMKATGKLIQISIIDQERSLLLMAEEFDENRLRAIYANAKHVYL